VAHADVASAFTSTTFQTLVVDRKPWMGTSPRTLPSAMSKA
jgi:hypothetical protein